ncbi:hypothetical protein [Thermococcus sp. JdF3]|uniref:hypothetical protein n=1 Tax=Thermococcus sp. JdF3 TaxID=1638258 RepID=UPI0014399E70|nr:hypothetical protein [Thermococcus sp. JdF3]NJE00925.1 hypothetical protein [Thermococcus sp. JdF3]
MSPVPPPIRGRPERRELTPELAERAIETVRNALSFFTAGMPIIHRAPGGEVHVDVPVMYLNFAVDRVHYDPKTGMPSPKGMPAVSSGGEVSPGRVREMTQKLLKELHVLDACEFRGPEDCWVVPVAWKSFIILHVRVSADGRELIPDYGLTEEVRRHGG